MTSFDIVATKEEGKMTFDEFEAWYKSYCGNLQTSKVI